MDGLTLTYLQAYGSSRIAAGKVQQILHWPGSFETFRKVPTCLLYDEQGQVLAWGLEAKNASPMPGTVRCEWCAQICLCHYHLHAQFRTLGSSYSWNPKLCGMSQLLILDCPNYRSVSDFLQSYYLFTRILSAWKKSFKFNYRLFVVSLGICQRTDNTGDWSGGGLE